MASSVVMWDTLLPLVTSYSTTVNEVSIFSTEIEQWTQFYSAKKTN